MDILDNGFLDALVKPSASSQSSRKLLYGKAKILVIDDDEVSLEIMKTYLQGVYDVHVVSSGKLALEFLATRTVDLILLDYMMPEMDGPTVFQHIRKDFPLSLVPIIFLTGVSEKELVIKGLELYPTDYLLKPIDQTVLLDRVRKILAD